MTSRESIYQALFAMLQEIDGFQLTSRKLRHWQDVPQPNQPALFLVQKGETFQRLDGLPPKRMFIAEIYLYARSQDPFAPPASILNPLMDAVETIFAPDASGNQTLGGLVQHAWIEGRVETDEGVLGEQAVVIVPVRILVP
jgi:hypothetical protein